MPQKKILPAKLAKPKGAPVKSMVDVMNWTFEKHTSPTYSHLRKLLEPTTLAGKKHFIEHKFPQLSASERNELLGLVTHTPARNARIHSRKVLDYMLDLILRHSTAPPPWRS